MRIVEILMLPEHLRPIYCLERFWWVEADGQIA